jgi:chromosome partitioning protein
MNVVVIANEKRGVGKTTVTVQLARALSRRHDVVVIDADRQGSTALCFGGSTDGRTSDTTAAQSFPALGSMRELEGRYHYVLVDTAPGVDCGAVLDAVMDAADFALVPMTPDPLAFAATVRTISRLIEPRGLHYSVLLNRIDPSNPRETDAWCGVLDSVYGIPRFEGCLRDYGAHLAAAGPEQARNSFRHDERARGAVADITAVGYELEAQFGPALAGPW